MGQRLSPFGVHDDTKFGDIGRVDGNGKGSKNRVRPEKMKFTISRTTMGDTEDKLQNKVRPVVGRGDSGVSPQIFSL